MSKKLSELESLLAELSRERDAIDTAVEQMMARMAETPSDQRSSNGWAPDGPLTREFLAMTNRQAELDSDIQAVTRDIAARKPPPQLH
jgi:hypothetical protein